jgi:hypothetical protein
LTRISPNGLERTKIVGGALVGAATEVAATVVMTTAATVTAIKKRRLRGM